MYKLYNTWCILFMVPFHVLRPRCSGKICIKLIVTIYCYYYLRFEQFSTYCNCYLFIISENIQKETRKAIKQEEIQPGSKLSKSVYSQGGRERCSTFNVVAGLWSVPEPGNERAWKWLMIIEHLDHSVAIFTSVMWQASTAAWQPRPWSVGPPREASCCKERSNIPTHWDITPLPNLSCIVLSNYWSLGNTTIWQWGSAQDKCSKCKHQKWAETTETDYQQCRIITKWLLKAISCMAVLAWWQAGKREDNQIDDALPLDKMSNYDFWSFCQHHVNWILSPHFTKLRSPFIYRHEGLVWPIRKEIETPYSGSYWKTNGFCRHVDRYFSHRQLDTNHISHGQSWHRIGWRGRVGQKGKHIVL